MQFGKYYKCDENWTPIPCRNLIEFTMWFKTANRTVLKTELHGITISTVFLGFTHFDNALPSDRMCLFESMVFARDGMLETLSEGLPESNSIFCRVFGGRDIQQRYETVEEARIGHAELVKVVTSALVKNG